MRLKNNYTPFLKFKANEIAALSMLEGSLMDHLTPFFDIPRRDDLTLAKFEETVRACRKKADRYLSRFPSIFLDCFDIPDSIASPGQPNCAVLVEAFEGFNYVPVFGLDRSADHNGAIHAAKAAGRIMSATAAIRLQPDDFAFFELVKSEIAGLIASGSGFTDWILIFDCRVCLNADRGRLAKDISDFVSAAASHFKIKKCIVTGSSIPSSISDVAKPSVESVIPRAELEIFHSAKSRVSECDLFLGDYTIVSPTYSDVTIARELLLGVTAPKVFYSFGFNHYVARGGRIKTKGYGQYDVIFEQLVAKSFYRGPKYSWGDAFIKSRADGVRDKNVTPSAVLKPTICAHITYMAQDYSGSLPPG